MKTIYVISDRYYSEGGNIAAFENKADAEAVCEVENGTGGMDYRTSKAYYIEEVEVYDCPPKSVPVYRMHFEAGRPPHRQSQARNQDETFIYPETPGVPSRDVFEELAHWPWSDWPPLVECKSDYWQNHIQVYGTNPEKVRKTYSDIKAQMVAEEQLWLNWEPTPQEIQAEAQAREETQKRARTSFGTGIPSPTVRVTEQPEESEDG